MQQTSAANDSITVLKEICLGMCSSESKTFLKFFAQPQQQEEDHAVNIYGTKLSVPLHNNESFNKIPSDLYAFDCFDEGRHRI